MDAPKYSWSGVLTQERTTSMHGQEIITVHPITYRFGKVIDFPNNKWEKLTAEAYAVYMTFKTYHTIYMMAKLLLNVIMLN